MAQNSPVWFITGASSGFGKAIALEGLKRGHRVIATARNLDSLDEISQMGGHIMSVDVTSDDALISMKLAEAISIYGEITHLVNSAGYILEGMIEECSTQEIFNQFNTNVLGSIKVIRAALPYMRKSNVKGLKVIANFGSTASWVGWPSSATYCSSKWAISGLTEGLAAEVAPFGIKATIIEPGTFRTRFLAQACGSRQPAELRMHEYKEARDMINGYMDLTDNSQLGDVAKGASVIVDVLTMTNTSAGKEIPARLPLGSDSIDTISDKCRKTMELLQDWDKVIRSTDYLQ